MKVKSIAGDETVARKLLMAAMTLLMAASLLIIASAPSYAQETEHFAAPMNVMTDSSGFKFYLNEEVLVDGKCEWKADGRFASEYIMTVSGQSLATSLSIDVDDMGDWTAMNMKTVQGDVEVTRDDTIITIKTPKETNTVVLKKGTVLFENFSPALMSHMVMAYDHEAGGKQTFPMFIIPALIMDASLEKLGTEIRTIAGTSQEFTQYRYGVPGVDVYLFVDQDNRVCFGDVPAQHGAYVRSGYEDFMKKEEIDTLISQARYEVVIDTNVMVPMRDGINLATDIYYPDAEGTFPIILVRTPYKKEMNEIQGKFYSRRGYVYAVQDCRGRFSSEGTWNPFFAEPNDGYDAIEWLAVQPWSNGKVGMIGASYLGWVQWWAARNRPPHLTTIIPNV